MQRPIPKRSRSLSHADFSSHSTENGRRPERVGPTPQRLAQAAAVGTDAVAEVVTEITDKAGRNERAATTRLYDSDVLELLFRRDVIDQEQYACGREFHRHWQSSGLASVGVVDPSRERVDGGSHKPESDQRLWHLNKWKAIVRLLGQVHSRILCACVLLDEPLQAYGTKHSKQKDAKRAQVWAQSRLTAALEELVIVMLGPKNTRRGASMMAGARPVIPPAEDEA